MTAEPLTLSIWDAKGQRHDAVLPLGGKARVCVGDPIEGPHSSIWNVWAGRRKSDVYIAVRNIAGWQKFSLHESGDWRHQFVNHPRVREGVVGPSRIMDQWEPPAEDGKLRLTHGFTIRCRHHDLADYNERRQFPKEVLWVPAPPERFATMIHVAISRIHDEPVNFGGLIPFAAFKLADGRAVILLASMQELSTEIDALIRSVREEIDQRGEIDLAAAAGPRMAFYGHDNATGSRFAWDIALRPQ